MKKILIEKLMRNSIDVNTEEIQWYCFKGEPKLCVRIEEGTKDKTTLYDENLNIIDDVLSINDKKGNRACDDLIKQTYVLAKKLVKPFKFVRIDFMAYQNKVYFEELTFTPYSGMHFNMNKKFNKYLGSLINL